MAFAQLRSTALTADKSAANLQMAAHNLTQLAANTIYQEVRLAPPPFAELVSWVDQLALMAETEAMPSAQSMETEVRALVADQLGSLHGSAKVAREAVATVENHYLETYWNLLREYALAHYVQERDVDEVLNELTERYVVGSLQRKQQYMEQGQLDPYAHER
jgi:hypothetical protein